MLMLIQALLAGLVVGISKMDYFFGYNMLNRPIVEGALMGLVLGDPVTGTIIGATLEIVFLGSFPVGAAVSPDGGTAAGVSTAFAIITGAGAAVGTAFAVPLALLGGFAFVLCKFINNAFAEAMKAQLAKDNDKAARALFGPAAGSELSACTSLSAFWVSSSAAPRSRRPSPPSPRRSSTALLPAATCFPPWASRSCSR